MRGTPGRRVRWALAVVTTALALAGCGTGLADGVASAPAAGTATTAGQRTPGAPTPEASTAGACALPEDGDVPANAADTAFLTALIGHREAAAGTARAALEVADLEPALRADAEDAADLGDVPGLEALLETCGTVPAAAAVEPGPADVPAGLATADAGTAGALYRQWAAASARAMVVLAEAHQADGARPAVLDVSARVLAEERERLTILEPPAG